VSVVTASPPYEAKRAYSVFGLTPVGGLGFEVQKVIFQNLAFVVPGPVYSFELQVPFGGLHEHFGSNSPADLTRKDIDAVTRGLVSQKIENTMNWSF
jgi:hypothetical protein